jgi:PAS domain S-box-containing protein
MIIANYQTIERICTTAGSDLYRARWLKDGTPVLLKQLDPEYAIEVQSARCFKREYLLLQSLDVAEIIKPIALIDEPGCLALVLEDFAGESFEAVLGGDQRLDLPGCLRIASHLAHALAGLHAARIIHQDIRPANILLARQNGEVRLVDFSSAMTAERATFPPEGCAAPTSDWAYPSPEQTGRMNRPVDYRTDFYSLGITLYRMLTGQLPFAANDPLEWAHCHIARLPPPACAIAPAIPQAVSDIVMKLLAKLPEERYQSARGLQADLDQCLAQWQTSGRVDPFPLGAQDVAECFHIPAAPSADGGAQLDALSITKALQAICGYIVLEELVDTLMRIVLENAGAQTGTLLLVRKESLTLAADARVEQQTVHVQLHFGPAVPEVPAEIRVPAAILNYVRRSREPLLLADVAQPNPFAADADFAQRQPKSVLCLPLLRKTALLGVLYLENSLVTHAFTPQRMAVLELLASQAAISLENALLYTDLQQENSVRKQAEEALREKEARIRRLIESNIIGIFFWDLHGGVSEANDAFLHMVGYTRDELLCGTIQWTDLTPPEYRAADERVAAEMRTTGTATPYEKEYIRKDGSRVPVLIGGALFDGSQELGVAFVLDLSERKQAEEALRKSEEQWRAIFEHNPTMYFMVDAAGIIMSVNSFGAEQLGYTVDELVGHSVLNLFHEADREFVKRNVAICLEQRGRTKSWEARKIRKDGTMLWVRETVKAMPETNNRTIVLIVCEDITERRVAQDELRRKEAFLAEGQKISHTGSWSWHIPTGKLVWSEEHYRILGLEPEAAEPTFQLFLERLHSEDRPVFQQILDHAIRARSGFNCEFRIALPDGSIKYLQVIGRPVAKPSGEIDEFIGTTMDITERKQAEAALRKAHDLLERRVLERTRELQRSNRQLASEVVERQRAEAVLAQRSQELARSNAELEQMAYVASHDLQEPLRMVASYLQLLEQRYGGRLDADAHEFIGFAVDGAKRMQASIDDLLTYSRVGTKAKSLQRTDCAAVVETALRSLRVAIGESAAQVECGVLPVVMGDAAQLTQLFQNLIANAIKFRGGQAPRIAVRAEPEDGFWRFEVQDNGIGIAPEYFERIFVMFQRLHSRSTYPGTGIGLAICKKIVERHGGRIWVESAPQRGSVFKFTLPRVTGDVS